MTDLHTKPQLTTIEVRNPADGTVVGEIPVDSPMRAAAATGFEGSASAEGRPQVKCQAAVLRGIG